MKSGSYLILLTLSLTAGSETPAAEAVAESSGFSPKTAVHERILELLKQDASKVPAKPLEAVNPLAASPASDPPVADDVLALEPIVVTRKKPLELPPRVNPVTLENFFYGDGTIFQSAGKRYSLSAGPEERGLAAIKFNIKF